MEEAKKKKKLLRMFDLADKSSVIHSLFRPGHFSCQSGPGTVSSYHLTVVSQVQIQQVLPSPPAHVARARARMDVALSFSYYPCIGLFFFNENQS